MIGCRRDVYNEIANGIRGSYTWWRGRSYAASVRSDVQNTPRARKKVSKDERKAMLESFVNSYRGMNAGKFPTPSGARKQVGGSYYYVRKILQELEYKSKISPLDKANECVIGKELSKENKPLSEVNKISGSKMTVDQKMQNDSQTVAINYVEVGDANSDHLEGKVESQTSSWIEERQGLPDRVRKPSTVVKEEAREASHPCISNLDGPKHTSAQYQVSPESDEFAREISGKQMKDEELPQRSTLWENLKSFADGIINMWRKH